MTAESPKHSPEDRIPDVPEVCQDCEYEPGSCDYDIAECEAMAAFDAAIENFEARREC